MARNEHKNDNKNDHKDEQIVEKLISVRRVTKVVKGGKIMRFSALVVVGDGCGRVGYASGKAREVPEAVKKAVDRARKTMLRVHLREGRTIHHDVVSSVGSGHVMLRSAVPGTGVIAGGSMRAIFEALGVQDVVAKSLGSANNHNVVRATFEALSFLSSPRQIASRLGKKLSDVVARREMKIPKHGGKNKKPLSLNENLEK